MGYTSSVIAFVAPYEALKKIADSLVPRYDSAFLTYQGNLQAGLNCARQAVARGASIVISRGGTATLIRASLDVQVIEVGISPYDLLQSLMPWMGTKEKIAVVGFASVSERVRRLCEILKIPATVITVQEEAEVEGHIRALAGLGVRCVIGDFIATDTARQYGLGIHLIESGVEAVAEAMDKADAIMKNIDRQLQSAGRIRAILNSVQEGIVSVDRNGIIEQINPKAEELLADGAGSFIGRNISDAIPGSNIASLIKDRTEAFARVSTVRGTAIAYSTVPIVISNEVSGAVSVIQDVGALQNYEKKVRRELNKKGLVARHTFTDFLYESPEMGKCLTMARRYARTTSNILLYGETGTGKEIMAQSIHNESPVKGGPFVAINCGALPADLLESELFGYVEGAFTGASRKGKMGVFELAHSGTIFLDEINELDVSLQPKLLRVIQEREIMRIGDDRVIPVTVRIIVASNKSLKAEVENGRMREDLYYRLNVLEITLPPLRQRRGDILLLFRHSLEYFNAVHRGKKPPEISPRLQEVLTGYEWPGNIRELENTAEKFMILQEIEEVPQVEAYLESLMRPSDGLDAPLKGGTLAEMEVRYIEAVLKMENGNVSRAAKRLGIDRNTLRRRIGRSAKGTGEASSNPVR